MNGVWETVFCCGQEPQRARSAGARVALEDHVRLAVGAFQLPIRQEAFLEKSFGNLSQVKDGAEGGELKIRCSSRI